jgi:hypothetical protein
MMTDGDLVGAIYQARCAGLKVPFLLQEFTFNPLFCLLYFLFSGFLVGLHN